jgi:hypothetical protein
VYAPLVSLSKDPCFAVARVMTILASDFVWLAVRIALADTFQDYWTIPILHTGRLLG